MNQSGKLLLFIFLFSTSYISLAHKPKKHPFDFRAEIGVNHSFFQAHYPYQEPIFCQNIFPIFSRDVKSLPSFQTGVDFNWNFNKHFTLSTGFLYQCRRTQIIYDKDQAQNYYDTSGISLAYSYRKFSGMAQIPLSMAYRYNRWCMDVGMSVPFYYHSVTNSESFTEKNRRSRSTFIWSENYDFQINALAKLGFEINIERKINIFASVSHTFFSKELEKTIYAIGVNASLSKFFGK